MKYIVMVSHGMFAPSLHSALKMLAGEERPDILSTSLENGMSSETFAKNVETCISGITQEDEILLFGDLVGGSPLTTASDVIAKMNLMPKTVIIGGMNLPLVLSASLMKDAMDTESLVAALLPEAREEIKEFKVTVEESEDEI